MFRGHDAPLYDYLLDLHALCPYFGPSVVLDPLGGLGLLILETTADRMLALATPDER